MIMKLAIRFRYYKPVTPSFETVELSAEQWREFLGLQEPEKRLDYMVKLLGKDYRTAIKELWWIPLDEGMEIKVRKQRKAKVTFAMPSEEEIEQYIEDYRKEILRINEDENDSPRLAPEELESSLNRMSHNSAIYYIQRGIPAKSVAYTEMYYL